MGIYILAILKKFLAATLVFSLLGPDLAKCMEEEKQSGIPVQSSSRVITFSKQDNDSNSALPKKEEDEHPNILIHSSQETLKSVLFHEKEDKEIINETTNPISIPTSSIPQTSQSSHQKALTEEEIGKEKHHSEEASHTHLISEEIKNLTKEEEETISNTPSHVENKELHKDQILEEKEVVSSQENIFEFTETAKEKKEDEDKEHNTLTVSSLENLQLSKEEKLKEEKKEASIEKIPSQTSMTSEETEDRKNEGKDNTNNSAASLENKNNYKNLVEIIEENDDSNKEHDDKGKEEKEEVGQNDNLTPSSQENPKSISFPMGEEDEEEFLVINPENQSSQRELETISDLETVSFLNEGNLQENFLKETPSQKILRLLRINPQNLTKEELEDLDKMMRIEGTWRNPLVWSNLEILIHKTLFALTTNKHAINKRKQKKCCSPLWLYGGPVPLEDTSAIKRNVTLKTLGSALEEGITEPINTILLALMGYQIYKLIDEKKWVFTPKSLVDFYFNTTDSVSYLAIIRSLHDHPLLFALLGIPLGFTAAKTLWNVSHISEPTEDAVSESIKDIKKRSLKWDGRFFNILSVIPTLSMLLFFHPLKRNIPGLATLILWEGKLPSEARENAFNAILELAKTRKGVTQMTAIESLAYLAHGMNIRNLMLHPRDVEGLLKIKLQAFQALQEIYKTLPCFSLNKLRTAVKLWEIGYSPSWRVSIVEPIVKVVLGALYGYSLFGLAQVLYDYFTCSAKYLEKFSWVGGLKSYASDYSKECFDAQVKVFNTLPGQPASTLVGNLTKYHFPHNLYDLDLSNKGINGSVLADIVEGFQGANVSLNSLNVSDNPISNASDIVRILSALPSEIKNLAVVNVDLFWPWPSYPANSFLGVGRLTGLKSLTLQPSSSGLTPFNNNVIGQILRNLPHLENLTLKWVNTNFTEVIGALKPSIRVLNLWAAFDRDAQIAFGDVLVNNLTLHQICLEAGGDGQGIGDNAEGNIALARGLAAQTNLSVLDLSENVLGLKPSVNVSMLLKSFPSSVTDLNLAYNFINETSAISALAQAVSRMSGLSSFKAGGVYEYSNALGNSPAFLKALQGKKSLTQLDLSTNCFRDITLIQDLLQTTPNLKVLNLHRNQLTNGSILAPALSKLRKLKILNLAGNNFTTEDRLAIWNAASFLAQSPFPFDEDLNFTAAYLRSLPFNTTSLNFTGLIPNDGTAFKTIMPIVAERFPNLKSLDLSNNEIVNENLVNNKIQIAGIEALISYLPQLKYIKTLKMSNSWAPQCYSTAIPYYQNLSYIIGQLPNLRSLDLSGTAFLLPDSLGKGLKKRHSLTYINLAGCWGDGPGWNGGEQLIEGLKSHTQLVDLDLSYNCIGIIPPSTPDPNTTLALANGLQSWPHLQSLNLATNWIGYQDPDDSSFFLEKLAGLASTVSKEEKTLNINLLAGIYNITWTKEASVFQNLTEQNIINACARQLCTGKALNTTATRDFAKEKRTGSEMKAHAIEKKHHIKPTSMTSAASTAVPFYQPLTNFLNPWFSWNAWGRFFDRGLDRVANGILSYSQQVADNAPGYFPGKLDNSKSLAERANKKFYNYPVPHFRATNQGGLIDAQTFNQAQGLNQTFSPSMLTANHQPLMLSK